MEQLINNVRCRFPENFPLLEEVKKGMKIIEDNCGAIFEKDTTINFNMNLSSCRTLGNCKGMGMRGTTQWLNNNHEISYNPKILKINSQSIMETVIHELLHAIKYGRGHTGHWKHYAIMISNRTKYDIQRLHNSDEWTEVARPTHTYRYEIWCENCNKLLARYSKMTKAVKNTKNYLCKRCHRSNLSVKDLFQTPQEIVEYEKVKEPIIAKTLKGKQLSLELF